MYQTLLLLSMSMICLTQLASADLYRHYKFDTLIENGAATPDASPHEAHARLSGQELCEGVIGKALRFEAGNKGVVLGDLSLQAPATLCFWLKSEAAASKPITPLGKLAKSEASKKPSQTTSVINGTDWFDVEGRPIQAHDGHITRVKDTFYWYGSSYAGNPGGIYGTVGGYAVWNGVQVYSSKDLVNWTYRGVALPRPKKGWGVVGSVGRAHVIYNEKTRKYVMWYWYHTTYPTVFVMVATSDTPVGPFKVKGAREVGSQTGFGSDLNVFKDDDGKAYLVYTDHHTYDESKRFDKGKGVYAILVDSLTDDYLDSNKEGVVAIPSRGEAPAMAKYRGKYIVAASGVNGWNPTETRYVVADSPLGPYSKPAIMTEQKTWGGQITSFLHIKESDTLMAMCDQWWTPDKKDLNKSRYLWLPVYLDSQTGTAKMKYYEKWNPFSPGK